MELGKLANLLNESKYQQLSNYLGSGPMSKDKISEKLDIIDKKGEAPKTGEA